MRITGRARDSGRSYDGSRSRISSFSSITVTGGPFSNPGVEAKLLLETADERMEGVLVGGAGTWRMLNGRLALPQT